MTARERQGPRVPVEKPDPEVARHSDEDGVDRPGFDLGGAKERPEGKPMRNPKGDPAANHHAPGRSGGPTNPAGSRSQGDRSGNGSEAGSRPTEGD